MIPKIFGGKIFHYGSELGGIVKDLLVSGGGKTNSRDLEMY